MTANTNGFILPFLAPTTIVTKVTTGLAATFLVHLRRFLNTVYRLYSVKREDGCER
jgi:hypothetical protein